MSTVIPWIKKRRKPHNNSDILVPLVCVAFDFMSIEMLDIFPFPTWYSDAVRLCTKRHVVILRSFIFLCYLGVIHGCVLVWLLDPRPCPLRGLKSHSEGKKNCTTKKWEPIPIPLTVAYKEDVIRYNSTLWCTLCMTAYPSTSTIDFKWNIYLANLPHVYTVRCCLLSDVFYLNMRI